MDQMDQMDQMRGSEWEEEARVHDADVLRASVRANEAPVELPMRSRAVIYVTLAALVAAVIALFVGAAFAGM